MSASIHFSPSFSLAILPSLLVFLFWFFRKFALKGCILLAAKRRKKKKKRQNCYLLSPLTLSVRISHFPNFR